jgi:hypothetical protein
MYAFKATVNILYFSTETTKALEHLHNGFIVALHSHEI